MPKIKIDGYQCVRCMYNWVPRKKSKPIVCPGCMSPYWDIKKIRA